MASKRTSSIRRPLRPRTPAERLADAYLAILSWPSSDDTPTGGAGDDPPLTHGETVDPCAGSSPAGKGE